MSRKHRKTVAATRPAVSEPVENQRGVERWEFGQGARQSVPKYASYGGYFNNIPRNAQVKMGLTDRHLRTYTVDQLLDILSEVHPDVSYAVWNFIRLGNSGYRIKVTKLDGSMYAKGERVIRDWLKSLEAPSSTGFKFTNSLDRVIGQLIKMIVIRGAGAAELVLSDDLEDASHVVAVDPVVISFKDDGKGRLVPWQNTIKLDTPRFFYEGLDTFVDDPKGVSPIASAIQTVFFQLQVLQDLKAVVHNQGYPKYDIKIVEKVLLERMPIPIRTNEAKKQEWLQNQMDAIVKMYNKLEPDDAFVHFDSTEVALPDGGKPMLDPEKLMTVINEQMNMALKTLSTIMGRRASGNTETFAKMEIKLYLKGLEDIQWIVENIMNRALTLVLNFHGLQGNVEMEFDPVEIRTALEQEQFRQIAIQNAVTLVDLGWTTDDEACRQLLGHDPTGTPNPEGLRYGKAKGGSQDEKGSSNPSNGG